ncbi:MAG: sigma E protease regulator RseP [Candidatus Schmidhempelia sp.]|nr:sigma E protease regulator RseP [Candidatus Schmidhempelia sp.]
MLWSILIFIVTICLLVTIHEFGHFWIARRSGVIVERFSIGFGPTLFTYHCKNGIQFIIGAIPLGGYVKMLDGRNDKLTDDNQQLAFDHQSIVKRAAIIAAGPLANFLFAFFIYWIVFQLGVLTFPVKIAHIVPNSVASTTKISPGAELKFIDNIKIKDWQDVQLALVNSIGKQEITITYLPDHLKDTVTDKVDLRHWSVDLNKQNPIMVFGFVPQKPKILPIFSQVLPNSAAQRAGLIQGDRVIQLNGDKLTDWNQLYAKIKQGLPFEVVVDRNGKLLTFTVTPDTKMVKNSKGLLQQEGFIGVMPETDTITKKYDAISALGASFEQTLLMIKSTVRSFYQLITGSLSLRNLSGPVTIAKIADQSASYGIVAYLNFFAFISISLGVVNLIPLPILDGGHLLFLFIEAIKGKPLSEQKQIVFYRFSFALLMLIMGVALFNDFSRL